MPAIESWNTFLATLQAEHQASPILLGSQYSRFSEFAQQLHERERISLLLDAYARYRELSPACGQTSDPFESSCYSILISAILATRLNPTDSEVIAILRSSFHERPYSIELSTPSRHTAKHCARPGRLLPITSSAS
jgi:hypothetical protein